MTNTSKQNRWNTWMTIVDEIDDRHVLVRFPEYDYETVATRKAFDSGTFKCPYDRTVQGIGCLGIGEYKCSKNGKATRAYSAWASMLRRVKDKHWINTYYPSYANIEVCEEWKDFECYAEWFYSNYWSAGDQLMVVDKDVLLKGNRLYAPDRCLIIPQRLNKMFEFQTKIKDDGLPVGVNHNKKTNRYEVTCNQFGKTSTYIGSFIDSEDAFMAYRAFKQNEIKKQIYKYKDIAPKKVFDAIWNYKIEWNRLK